MNRRVTSVRILLTILMSIISWPSFAQDVLKSKDSIPIKVIVTADGGCSLYDRPGGTGKGRLNEMDIRLVLKPASASVGSVDSPESSTLSLDGESWYYLADLDSRPAGFVKKKDVSEWSTRSLLKPLGNPTRPFVAYTKGSPSKPDTSDKSAQITFNGMAPDDYRLLVPVLKPRESEDSYYECVVFGGNFNSKEGAPQAKTSENKSFGFDVVFVIDTTASMTPMIEGVKEVAARVASSTTGKGVEGADLSQIVRFGLVEYQDSTPGLTPSKITIPLTNATDFARKVSSIQAASKGSEEWQEDVIAGVVTAIDRDKTSRRFGSKMGWRDGSNKWIFLCGDASAHLPGSPKSTTNMDIAAAIDLAQGNKSSSNGAESTLAGKLDEVFFGTVFVKNDDGNADWSTWKSQLRMFNESKLLEANLPMEELDVQSDDSKKRVVDALTNVFKLGIDALATGKVTEDARNTSPLAKIAGYYFDDKPFSGAKMGFAKETNDYDQATAIETWFVTRGELDSVRTTTDFLHDKLKKLTPEQRASSEKLLTAIQEIYSLTGTGDKKLDDKSKLSSIMSGLPIKSPIFEKSIDDIATMSQEAYADFLRDIKATATKCETLLADKKYWLQLGSNSGEPGEDVDSKMVGFLDISILP